MDIGEFSIVGRRPSCGGVVRPASLRRLDSEILYISYYPDGGVDQLTLAYPA